MRPHELTDMENRLRALAAKLGRTGKDFDLEWHHLMLKGALEAFKQDSSDNKSKNDKKHPLTHLQSMAKKSNSNTADSRIKLNFLRCLYLDKCKSDLLMGWLDLFINFIT